MLQHTSKKIRRSVCVFGLLASTQQAMGLQQRICSQGCGRAPKKKRQKAKPWNAGKKLRKTDRQHLFVPRDHLKLWFGVLLYSAGPVYAFAIWLCMVTSRRISETLRLRSGDLVLHGGAHDDHPHILYQLLPDEKALPGMHKLGGTVAARLCREAVSTIEAVSREPLTWRMNEALAEFKEHASVKAIKKPLCQQDFQVPADASGLLFAAARSGGKLPWRTRQSAGN